MYFNKDENKMVDDPILDELIGLLNGLGIDIKRKNEARPKGKCIVIDSLKNLEEFFDNFEKKRKEPKKEDKLDMELRKRGIEGIFYNETKKIVVIKWRDGEITKATCAKEDDFDLTVGFSIAYCKKKFKSKSHLNKLINDNAKRMDKDVAPDDKSMVHQDEADEKNKK